MASSLPPPPGSVAPLLPPPLATLGSIKDSNNIRYNVPAINYSCNNNHGDDNSNHDNNNSTKVTHSDDIMTLAIIKNIPFQGSIDQCMQR